MIDQSEGDFSLSGGPRSTMPVMALRGHHRLHFRHAKRPTGSASSGSSALKIFKTSPCRLIGRPRTSRTSISGRSATTLRMARADPQLGRGAGRREGDVRAPRHSRERAQVPRRCEAQFDSEAAYSNVKESSPKGRRHFRQLARKAFVSIPRFSASGSESHPDRRQ